MAILLIETFDTAPGYLDVLRMSTGAMFDDAVRNIVRKGKKGWIEFYLAVPDSRRTTEVAVLAHGIPIIGSVEEGYLDLLLTRWDFGVI